MVGFNQPRMSILSNAKIWYQSFYSFIRSERFLLYFASLPLFFSWLPVITWNFEKEKLRDISLYGCVHFLIFLTSIVLSVLSTSLPFVGAYLANVFHTAGIISYLCLSGFLVYLVATEKKIVIPVVSQLQIYLMNFIEGQSPQAPIAQLDRASDYGSEG